MAHSNPSSTVARSHYTKSTTHFWQTIHEVKGAADDRLKIGREQYTFSFPALLPCDRILELPIRELPTTSPPRRAVCSLFIDQASIEVSDALAFEVFRKARNFDFDAIVGLPTLGLGLTRDVVKCLTAGSGQPKFAGRYVPLGQSRKFWYEDELSTPVSSILTSTTPKRLYLDPNLLPLVKEKKVLIIDDAVSSGTTLNAVWDFLESDAIKAEVVGACVVMSQGGLWKELLGPERGNRVNWVLECPLLVATPDGWTPIITFPPALPTFTAAAQTTAKEDTATLQNPEEQTVKPSTPTRSTVPIMTADRQSPDGPNDNGTPESPLSPEPAAVEYTHYRVPSVDAGQGIRGADL